MAMKAGTVRLTVDVEPDLYEWVTRQRAHDRIKTTERVRALLSLAREDGDLQDRVSRRVTEMDLQQAS